MTRIATYVSAGKVMAIFAVIVGALLITAGPASAHHFDKRAWRERRHIKERAKNVIGTPYSYGGSSRSGFDCSGFTSWTYRDHGADLPRTSLEQFNLAKREGPDRIWKRKNLKKGDLVFHKTTSARVGHVGIYIGHGKFISATSSGGVQVRSLFDPYYWGPRWVGATRLPITMDRR